MTVNAEAVILRNSAGHPTHAVLTYAQYLNLTAGGALEQDEEDAEDAAALAEAVAADDGFRLPLAHVGRLQAGEHVLKVLRDFRGMDQAELARRIGSAPNYISQIETGARRGARMAQALADALGVPVEIVKAKL